MSVVVVTPPQEIVSLDEAKRHLRVEHAGDDAYIESLVAVATGWLDGPDGWLGRALGEQVLEAAFPTHLAQSDRSYSFPPFRALVSEVPQPDGRETVVRWRAGYPIADGKSAVPAPVRHAILLMVGHLYANRDAVTMATAKPEQLPLGVEALLAPFRVWAS
ncbi:hypothetical protein BV511_03145 [Methylorubrum extorquens]|uniref:head-tail connector protein n=1 Tax=Methylorubrum extorquens TaxID=408 RepID=UPI000972E043|nr:head-tail connector protein [Methylorubrum extorquens]APX83811.1 hypothetical protein BV511_03145 [Methylorubrum extorquens]